MKAIRIKIVNFISDDQPGFVECSFFDAWNKEHRIQEKIPVITEKELDEYSNYPQDGVLACEVIKTWKDKNNRKLYKVTTEKPWDIETLDGLNEFDVLGTELIEINE